MTTTSRLLVRAILLFGGMAFAQHFGLSPLWLLAGWVVNDGAKSK